jgi:hypothetical protein
MQSHRPAIEQFAQLLEPRHPRDVALDRRTARCAIPNPLAKTAAPTHGFFVKLENARKTAANRAKKK